ncbi:MAG TPA: nuclear transport factor 2 family protein [Bacillota bacterium]|nr:nuclear transport factor 2 family protein [Bacillota bacterium]
MNEESAYYITKKYFDSWLKQDKKEFSPLLHEDVVIQECTGDVYNKKKIAEKWFEGWNIDGNKVLRWDINNNFFDRDKETVFVEWEFECLYEFKKYAFQGASTISFKGALIYKLNEYQMNIEKKYPYK